MKKVSLKDFISELKSSMKGEYFNALWPVGGFFIIFIALSAILLYFFRGISSSIMMNIMMVMYGMASAGAIGLGLLEMLVALGLILAVNFFYGFIQVAIQYAYLDRFHNPDDKVTAASVWGQYKRLNKNQLWRLALYIGLFMFLWTLPLDIVAGIFARNQVVVIICRVVNLILVVWKSLQYSQAYFVYRVKRPDFLGQSMRHALTASKRFMKGLKWNLLLVAIVTIVLPIVIWLAIFSGLGYYGIYTATNFWIWFGFIVAFLGLVAWLPVAYAAAALYYHKAAPSQDLEAAFNGTFKSVEELTGQK
ncbi:hypothetical protein [uncultured Limosilactobacillus sp.]|uniref:hypothetical protein n=1 Tax=uncultured Limosilactobacillus sp. TaxID=2837629 RepID=UPI0025DBB48C|nr:hypothetical protein [uncultured Limosilactobacillus sp.]